MAVNVTCVEPIGNEAAASFETVGLSSTESLAVNPSKNDVNEGSELDIPLPDVAVTVTSAGKERVGAVVSETKFVDENLSAPF